MQPFGRVASINVCRIAEIRRFRYAIRIDCGMHLRGRAENFALHSALFRGVLKGTRLSAEVESIVPLSSGVALVHTAGSGRKRSYQTYVLVKSGADWLIRSFQNTRVQPLSVWITRWAQRRADSR